MHHIQGIAREQNLLLPPSLEECIRKDSPVWVIDAFVESVDLEKLGFHGVKPAQTGRPRYNPRHMSKLYLYGFTELEASTRVMERETHRNIEVMWLVEGVKPDFKTIADFRRENKESLIRLGREFIVWCNQMNLLGKELIAVDGSKFGASNALRRSATKEYLQRVLREAEVEIQEYLKRLEEREAQEEQEGMAEREDWQAKVQQMQKNQQRYTELLQTLEEKGGNQVCLTDPDSRVMKTQGVFQPSYNVQTVIDSKHHLIVDQEVVQEGNDKQQLAKMAIRAQEVLGVEQVEVVADSGYYSGEEIARCEERGMTCYVPPIPLKDPRKTGIFSAERFVYDRARDGYRCPAGATLTYQREEKTRGRMRRIYQTPACVSCVLKEQCTKAKTGKTVYRTKGQLQREQMQQRLHQHPEKVKLRQWIVEHPFGTLKRSLKHGQLLLRGWANVKVEISLRVLAYNIKRVIQILGIEKFREALKQKRACASVNSPISGGPFYQFISFLQNLSYLLFPWKIKWTFHTG